MHSSLNIFISIKELQRIYQMKNPLLRLLEKTTLIKLDVYNYEKLHRNKILKTNRKNTELKIKFIA